VARAKKGKAASSAALNIHLLGILTWNDALWRDAWPLLPRGEWHANGDRARCGMMCDLFMAVTGVVLDRFFMMARCVFVMFCRFCMMFCALLGHSGF
jgi:hypothetical protein